MNKHQALATNLVTDFTFGDRFSDRNRDWLTKEGES